MRLEPLYTAPEDYANTHSAFIKIGHNMSKDLEAWLRILKLSETVFQALYLITGSKKWLNLKQWANLARVPGQLVMRTAKAADFIRNPMRKKEYWKTRVVINTISPYLFCPFGAICPALNLAAKRGLIEPWNLGAVQLWGGLVIGNLIAGAGGIIGYYNDSEICDRMKLASSRIELPGGQYGFYDDPVTKEHKQARAAIMVDGQWVTSLAREKAVEERRDPDKAQDILEKKIRDFDHSRIYELMGGSKYLLEWVQGITEKFILPRLEWSEEVKEWISIAMRMVPRCLGVVQAGKKHGYNHLKRNGG